MNILHYTLGLPPYRSGGLTKYATDLMLMQKKKGLSVFLLYPKSSFLFDSKICFKKHKEHYGIKVFSLNNTFPIPLLCGVKEPKKFMNTNVDITGIRRFLKKIKPDVLHIHSLMGLPIEVIQVARQCHIKVIFTAHDYYGLCLKTNFINNANKFCLFPSGRNCAICNKYSNSILNLYFRNNEFILPLVREILNFVPKRNVRHTLCEDLLNDEKKAQLFDQSYQGLLDYYKIFYQLFDKIHFNSSVTCDEYSKYIDTSKSVIIPITHRGILDNRQLKSIGMRCVSIGFIGPLAPFKGFALLKESLLKLHENGLRNWTLDVWGTIKGTDTDCSQIIYRGKYSTNNLAKVYNKLDLLVVPSIWKETFSLVALEALSFGVPVIVSNTVGAREIVKEYNPNFIFNTKEDLKNLLLECLTNPQILEDYNQKIIDQNFSFSMEEHTKKILEFYGV